MDFALTAPQQKIVDLLSKLGRTDWSKLSAKGCDKRALNNLVKTGVVCDTSGTISAGPKWSDATGSAPVKVTPNVVKAALDATKKPAATKPEKTPRQKKVIEPHACLCGCGAVITSKSRFLPGHDAKLHSAVLKAYKAEQSYTASSNAQLDYLRSAPWMTAEILEACFI